MNRLVNLQDLKEIVDKNLTICKECNIDSLSLDETKKNGFASTLEICCVGCDDKMKASYQSLNYLDNKVADMPQITTTDKTNRMKYVRKAYIARVIHKSLILHKQRRIISSRRSRGNEDKNRTNLFSHQLNLRAYLSAFYTGTGGRDVGFRSNMLGIRGGKTWAKQANRHGLKANAKNLGLAAQIFKELMELEIRATITETLKKTYTDEEIDRYVSYFLDGKYEQLPTEIRKVGIIVSFDMGWQKRSTGRVYDSLSGHGFIIGVRTKNVIGFGLRKKGCSICSKANGKNVPAGAHKCQVNWSGSSGAMESSLALDLISDTYRKFGGNVFIEKVVSDDDSTMRSHCKNEKNGGKLVDTIPEPEFLADPSHRIKVMVKPIFKLCPSPPVKDPGRCKTIDCLRLKKYTGCMITKCRHLPLDKFVSKAKAPIKHVFGGVTVTGAGPKKSMMLLIK